MRDGRALVRSAPRHFYPTTAAGATGLEELEELGGARAGRATAPHRSQGLTPMNAAVIRALARSRTRGREVSERKQVGDAESWVNQERRLREDDDF